MHTRTCKICGSISNKWVLRKGKPTGQVCRPCQNAKYREYAKAQAQAGRLQPKRAAYCATRRATDPLFKTKGMLQTRTRRALDQYTASSKTAGLFGCSYQELRAWLTTQFKPGMQLNNYGDWQVDHRIPLCKATSLDELYALCHWSNLQPLWGAENALKRAAPPSGWALEMRLLVYQYG